MTQYDAVTYCKMGVEYSKYRFYLDKAIALFEKAIEVDPKYMDTYISMGIAYNWANKYDKAIESYERAIGVDPKYIDAYVCMGMDYRRAGKYDKAIETCERALSVGLEHKNIYYNIAMAFVGKGDREKEVHFMEKAARLGDEFCQERLVKYNTIKTCEKAVSINPKSADAYFALGNAYSENREFDKAISAFRKATKLNPDDAITYLNIGVAQAKKKEFDKAINTYVKTMTIKPYLAAVANFNIAEAYDYKGNHPKAIHYYQQAAILAQNKSQLLPGTPEEFKSKCAELI